MNIAPLMFYILSGVMLSSAMMVVVSRNTVHGVLFLILTFLNAAGLFILLQAEFLAMILVVVYVGAVAVLFLFVVMMLNVSTPQMVKAFKAYTLIGLFVGGVFASELILMVITWKQSSEAFNLTSSPVNSYGGKTNTQVLGDLLYTHYALVFQGAGVVLLVAMIGAIVLTLRQREGVRRQKPRDQVNRKAKESVTLVDIPLRRGT